MSRHRHALARRDVPAPAVRDGEDYPEEDNSFQAQLARREAMVKADRMQSTWPDGRPQVERYRGGPTAEEQRHAWQRTHRHGVSSRELAPGRFALYFAWRRLGRNAAASERFNEAGYFDELRESVFDDMVPDGLETVEMVAQSRIFDKELMGELMRSRLPEMVVGASTPAQIGQALRDLDRVPDWVWNAGRKSAAEVRGELEEA